MSTKKRSANFSTKEESVLVSLGKKYKSILECKMTDMKTHHEKGECWSKLEAEFNACSGEVYRSRKVLRKKYDNIKKRVKHKYAKEKCFARGTEGGPPQDFEFNDVDIEIKEILGMRIEGHQSEFDGDADSKCYTFFLIDYKNSNFLVLPEREANVSTPDVIVNDSNDASQILLSEQSKFNCRIIICFRS